MEEYNGNEERVLCFRKKGKEGRALVNLASLLLDLMNLYLWPKKTTPRTFNTG